MRRLAALVLSVVAVGALGVAPATAATPPLQPVGSVDLSRYTGQWYQLASIPALFEIQCAKNVTARYATNPDGTVVVTNACTTWINTTSTVTGTAKVTNPPANSALNVSFFSLFGKPVYGSSANYLVFGIDPSYRWALVGSADRRTGFVLSRTPQLSAADVATITRTISANGFDLCAFRVTKQDGGAQNRDALC